MAECVKGTKVNTPAVDALLEARRRRQLKKQENLERLTTGDFSVWQMSKTLGPRQARKIGKKMGYIQARGEGPVKSIFLGISENYKARARAQENREHRYMLANLQAKYSLEKQRRKRWIEALRMKQEGKIEDADVIELSYTVRPQSGKDDRGALFPSPASYVRARTAPTETLKHLVPWDRRFGVQTAIREQTEQKQRQYPGGSSRSPIRRIGTSGQRPQTSALNWDWANNSPTTDMSTFMTRVYTPMSKSRAERPSTVGFCADPNVAEIQEEKTEDTPSHEANRHAVASRGTSRKNSRQSLSRSGLRHSHIRPITESNLMHMDVDRPQTVSTPAFARQIVPPSTRGYSRKQSRMLEKMSRFGTRPKRLDTSVSSSERLLRRKLARAKKERVPHVSVNQFAIGNAEAYSATCMHLESHPMWDKMYNDGKKTDDDEDDT